MNSAKGFDRLAPYYDRLARLVYGKGIERAQEALITQLPIGARILLLGGGTGSVLNHLEAIQPRRIDYLDASPAMIAQAQTRPVASRLPINWIPTPLQAVAELPEADVLITQFFLDVFSQQELPELLPRLSATLVPGGTWLYADFLPPAQIKNYQKPLLWATLQFFRGFCGLSAKAVSDHEPLLQAIGYRARQYAYYASGMIKVVRLQKGQEY